MVQSIEVKKVKDERIENIAKKYIGEHKFYLYTPCNEHYGWRDSIEMSRLRNLILKYKIVYVYTKETNSLCRHSVVERQMINMKKTEKITIILRDAQGRPHMVKIYVGSNVDIDIYGGNMVMNRPRKYDTNKADESKKFKYDGGMEFKATPERVAKFNTYSDSYDAQSFIHDEWMKEDEAGGLPDLITGHCLNELAKRLKKEGKW